VLKNVPRTGLLLLLFVTFLSCGGGDGDRAVLSVSLEAGTTQLPPGGSTNIIASAGTVPEETFDAKVSFSFRRNESGAVLDVINSRLDGNGEARAIYTAGSNPGIDVIEASFVRGAKATVSITVGHGVGSIRLEQFANTVLATALSATGLPVPGALIDLFITAGTIFINPGDATDSISATTTAVTNENGVTQPVMFSLPAGVNTARVTASSVVVSATLDVVRTSALSTLQTHSNVLSSSQITSSIYLEQEDNTIRAKLRDALGAPVAGALLSFAVKDGVLDKEIMLTDEDGVAEQMFLLNKDVAETEILVQGSGMSASLIVHSTFQ